MMAYCNSLKRLVDVTGNKGCQPAFRVGPTVGPLSVSSCSKCYLVLLRVPRKLLTLRSLQTCQGSGVGSIPISRSTFQPLTATASSAWDHEGPIAVSAWSPLEPRLTTRASIQIAPGANWSQST